ncbi:glycosyltransferase family 61 protein [Fibrella arboris]|uniref:glycosyltransferase family 61 protein n=1 Tax=Fibrella arboris TaxID=3242486 RepID=UPI0035217DE6
MPTITVISRRLKDRLKHFSPALLQLVGLKLLTKAQTEALLRPFQVSKSIKSPITLKRVVDAATPEKELFHTKVIETDPDFVWDYPNNTGRASLLRSGNLAISKAFLDTDFGNQAIVTDLLKPDKRTTVTYPVVIAPWSHYWGTYSDFLLFVVAKLARIKTVLTPAQFDKAVVAYPLSNTPYEAELLGILGVGADRLIDSRLYIIQFERCILANNSSWFYPAAADLLALRSLIDKQIPFTSTNTTRRIYISRKARRKVNNEEALTTMLRRHDFDIIDDKPRSVREQIALYRSASFIIGPHGASFSNILWCRPGTQLFELFAPNYRPEYFRYMSQVLGLRHAAYCLGPPADSHYTFLDADIDVSIDEVERGVLALLSQAGA